MLRCGDTKLLLHSTSTDDGAALANRLLVTPSPPWEAVKLIDAVCCVLSLAVSAALGFHPHTKTALLHGPTCPERELVTVVFEPLP